MDNFNADALFYEQLKKEDVWVRLGQWQSNHAQGVHVLDLGAESVGVPRVEFLTHYGRSGFTPQFEEAYDGSERTIVFRVEHEAAYRALMEHLPKGRQFEMTLSTDGGYIRRCVIQRITRERFLGEQTLLTVEFMFQPFKWGAVQTWTLQNGATFENKGDAPFCPIVTINQYVKGAEIKVGEQAMRLGSLDASAVVVGTPPSVRIDCENLEITSRNAQGEWVKQNSYRTDGDFFRIPHGRHAVVIRGPSTGITLSGRMGYL